MTPPGRGTRHVAAQRDVCVTPRAKLVPPGPVALRFFRLRGETQSKIAHKVGFWLLR